MFDSWKIQKLRLRNSSQRKKESPKPNLFYVSLMSVLSYYLFYCKFTTTLDMFAQPDQAETSPTKQLHFFKAIRKSITKGFFFLFSQPKTLT